jgi:lipoate-protein ligase A
MIEREWTVLFDGPRAAAAQMALDERLTAFERPMIRVFTWQPPAVSLGFKQPRPDWLVPSQWEAHGLEWVERPTGGGMAFHGSDVSISVTVPRRAAPPLETAMRIICESAVRLCRAFGADATVSDGPTGQRIDYCLTEPAPYAVMIAGRKIAGFAARRYPTGWLIQGSLLVRSLPAALARAVPAELAARLEAAAIPLASAAPSALLTEREVARAWVEQWEAVSEPVLS